MPVDTAVLSPFFATLTLACWAALVAGTVAWLAAGRRPVEPAWRADLAAWALPLAWLVALTATVGSLYYSEIVGYEPCRLCWYQRIAAYPLVGVLGVAALRRDPNGRWYAAPLVAVGIVISAYHSWLQAFPPDDGSAFCAVGVPCTTRHVWEMGFVSLPFMAFTTFVTIGALLAVTRPVLPERNPS